MLQFPAFMRQYPWSTRTIPTSFLLPSQWPQPHSEEFLLTLEESEFEEKGKTSSLIMMFFDLEMLCILKIFVTRHDFECNEIRKTNSNLIVIGKTTVDNDKEDFDNDADDDDADHGDESEGEEFEQETA
ncbi:hypothetical protein WN944_013292 [Citrus x changshan-huyou]|uniref:Uncharacterized protein n=1 Tax=Citrus x changshan-huyou TaxID=2935761 RepID=A0AAP0QKD0_9ROSI